MSVRCVVWLDEASLLVGTLDGLLYRWNFERREEEPMIVQQLEGSVIHMRWAHSGKVQPPVLQWSGVCVCMCACVFLCAGVVEWHVLVRSVEHVVLPECLLKHTTHVFDAAPLPSLLHSSWAWAHPRASCTCLTWAVVRCVL